MNVSNQNNDLINLNDAQLAKLWRVEKKEIEAQLLELEDSLMEVGLTKGARRRAKKKIKVLTKRAEILKAASSRHMSEVGKKGAAKMSRRAKQKCRREQKELAKIEHEAKIAERHAKREAMLAERQKLHEEIQLGLDHQREKLADKLRAKRERISGFKLARMTRATA